MVVIALSLTGCAGTAIGLRSTNSPSLAASAPPGSSYSTASIQAEVRPGPYFGLVFVGYILAGIQGNYQRWGYGAFSSKPPELAEERTVVERDCSRPLGSLYANLRCVPAAH